MRHKRILLVALLLLAGALLAWAAGPSLASGLGRLFFVFAQVVSFVLALPQILWWLSAGMALSVVGLYVALGLGRKAMGDRKRQPRLVEYKGRLSTLRDYIFKARSGTYSPHYLRQALWTLAADMIAVKSGLTRDEARDRLKKGDWSGDEALRSYFSQEGERRPKKRRTFLAQPFRPADHHPFLHQTEEIVERLQRYWHSIELGGEFEATDADA